MADIFEIVGKVSLDGLDKAEKELNNFSETGEKSSSKLSKLGGIATTLGKGLLVGTAAVATAGVGLVKQVSASYGALQQSIGGIETLFGESAQKVIDNANKAYTTAGMSANDYMQQVTSFSASLLQSVGGDTEKAANSADMAIRDMSDNANKMGTSMEMITNAYQGFAKQNYTMLDNLKLGYGGTKTEMERLLADAEKISGIKYDINNLDDVYQAIHVIQGELGITGTTAKEAGATIEGSFGSLSAAWENFIAGLGNPSADMKTIIDALAKSISGAITNVIPVVENMVAALPTVVSSLTGAIKELLPTLISTFTDLIKEVINGIVDLLPTAIPLIVDCFLTVAESLIEVLPQLIDALIQLISELISKLSEMLPSLIPTIIDGLVQIANSLIDNAPVLLDAVLQLITGIADALLDALPTIIDALPDLISGIADFLTGATPTIIEAAIELFSGIITALPDIITSLTEALPEIITTIADTLVTNLPILIDGAIQLVTGLVSSLPEILAGLINALPEIMSAIWDGICNIFSNAPEWFGSIFSAAWDAICAVFSDPGSFFGAVWDAICNVFSGVVEWFGDIFSRAWDAICNAFSFVGGFFSGVWNSICNAFSGVVSWFGDIFSRAWDAICNAFSAVGSFFSGIWDAICNAFSGAVSWFGDIFSGAWDATCNAFSGAGSFFSGVWDGICNAFSGVVDFFSKAFKGAWDAIVDIFGGIGDFFLGLWDKIKSAFSSLGTKIGNAISGAVKKAINGLIGMIESVINGGIDLINGAIGLVSFGLASDVVPHVNFPRLAKGGVLYDDTVFVGGEYDNASTNPEIVTPQNIMRETFDEVLTNKIKLFSDLQSEQLNSTFDLISGQISKFTNQGFIDKAVGNIVSEDPAQKYQFEFNNQFNILNDSVERLIGIINEYLPEIANGLDREIVLDSGAMAVGISQKIDRELGKRKLSKGRGNV